MLYKFKHKYDEDWTLVNCNLSDGKLVRLCDGLPLMRRLSDMEDDPDTIIKPVYNYDRQESALQKLADLGQEFDKSPTGGPSTYYDFPFSEWVTTNDMAEHLAENQWGKFGIHLKEILKASCRWGTKKGTTEEYDSKKIIYYGARLLRMTAGVKALRKYLQELLDHPQFKETQDE